MTDFSLELQKEIDPEALTKEPPEPRLRAALRAVGSPDVIAAALEDYGFQAPAHATIAAWMTRNSMPLGWCILVISVMLKRGMIKDPADLIAPPSPWAGA